MTKLWIATTLAAILLAACNAKAYLPFNDGYANEEQDDTTQDIDAGMEQYPDYPDYPGMERYPGMEQYPDYPDNTPDANMQQFTDTGAVQTIAPNACLRNLYILAFTAGSRRAGADKDHEVEVRAAGETKVITLPNLPGDDYQRNKGDLWKLTFDGNFGFTRCVTVHNIKYVAIESGSNDGWIIDSIVTYVGATGHGFMELTHDFNVFRLIDGNGRSSRSRRFMLNKVA